MTRKPLLQAVLAGLVIFSTLASATPRPNQSRDTEFDALVDDFLPKYWRAFPTEATGAGVHTYDGELEDLSAAGVAEKVSLLRNAARRVKRIPPQALSQEKQIDHDILLKALQWGIADYEQVKSWKKNPGLYNDLASYSLFLLFLRHSAPPEERARAAVSRMRKIPAVFAAGRANLTAETPGLAVETAVRDTKGTVDFLERSVRDFLTKAAAGDARLAAEIDPALQAAIAATKDYVQFLEKDLQPRAKGSYVLGRKLYILKSAHAQEVDLSPETITERGLAEVRRLQGEMRKVAAEVAPGKSLAEALAMAAADHPSASDLLPTYRSRLEDLKRFVVEHKLVTIPPGDKLEILETPEFARSMISAAVFPAGAFEAADLTTYYVVTPIDLSRPPAQQEEQLREHSLAAIDVVSIHEAFPGHHVQLLKARAEPSRVRKFVANGVFMEGWAHYCEQMMIEQRYHSSAKLRLFMLKDALLRAARMYLDPQIATGKMTYEQAKAFYANEAYQSAVTAEMEARRAALSPATVYIYTVGKLWIQELEAKERKRLGTAFQLGEFHDRLLAHGSLPLPVVAKQYFHTSLAAK